MRANSGPTSSRAACGISSPIQPMMPAMATAAAVISVAQVTITSNVEAATLMKTYPDLQMVGSSNDMRNKRPFAYPMPQGDEVWLTFVNNWIALKTAEGFFAGLEAKWLSAK